MQLRWVEKGLSRLEVTDPALEGQVENFLDEECGRSRFSMWLSKPIVSLILDAILKIQIFLPQYRMYFIHDFSKKRIKLFYESSNSQFFEYSRDSSVCLITYSFIPSQIRLTNSVSNIPLQQLNLSLIKPNYNNNIQ